MSDVYFFGCWNESGHYLHEPGGRRARGDGPEWYGDRRHLDGTLAPRIDRRTGLITWLGMSKTSSNTMSSECPQGQFLRHELNSGFTAIQWWDRNQGDSRSACNSTFLWRGQHTSEEMLAELAEHFPHALARLTAAGISLIEVHP